MPPLIKDSFLSSSTRTSPSSLLLLPLSSLHRPSIAALTLSFPSPPSFFSLRHDTHPVDAFYTYEGIILEAKRLVLMQQQAGMEVGKSRDRRRRCRADPLLPPRTLLHLLGDA